MKSSGGGPIALNNTRRCSGRAPSGHAARTSNPPEKGGLLGDKKFSTQFGFCVEILRVLQMQAFPLSPPSKGKDFPRSQMKGAPGNPWFNFWESVLQSCTLPWGVASRRAAHGAWRGVTLQAWHHGGSGEARERPHELVYFSLLVWLWSNGGCSGGGRELPLVSWGGTVVERVIPVCLQAKRAVQRGATAVIFDVSENPDAIDQVCAHLELPRRPRPRPQLVWFRPQERGQAECVFAQTMIFLSLVPVKSARISRTHSTILGLSAAALSCCVSEAAENGYPGSAFTRPWPNWAELIIAQVVLMTSPAEFGREDTSVSLPIFVLHVEIRASNLCRTLLFIYFRATSLWNF